MKQQVMTEPGKIIFKDVPIIEPKVGEVLIKIQRIGVCGSDIHVNHGKHPYTSYPVTQGHEVSGVIEHCGFGVTDCAVGDLVTIQPQVVCGICYPCTHGAYHICDDLKVMGFQTTGMASEFFTCDADRVLKLPDDMTPDEGAMVEPVAVACHALSRSIDPKGKKIVVMGAGPIGNLVGQAAKGLGAESVLITDLSDFRLGLAKEVGLDHTVNPSRQDLGDAIVKAFGSDKADLILECVGVQSTMEAAITNARKGTDIIVVGVFGDRPLVDLGLVQDHEIRLIGTAMYQTCDYMQAIELIEKGSIQLEPLMTDHFAFEDYEKAYAYLDEAKDRAMKVFIDLD
ncbi:MAG: alcohol dehydrogenase catalytic domain-containing protein [Spirochaetia bacterium]|nr:alcohol dehydrogenase catalytic domain-containing protein [Spirochaetia bacterium]